MDGAPGYGNGRTAAIFMVASISTKNTSPTHEHQAKRKTAFRFFKEI
jgi:hypothetical protein